MDHILLFGVPIFRYHLDPTELRRIAEEKFRLDLPINGNPDGWDCELKTDFPNSLENTYTPFYDDIMAQFSKDLKLEDSVAMIHESWLNYYVKGMNQEEHDHTPSFYSGIHFIKFNPEVHSSPMFMNPLAQLYSMSYESRSDIDVHEFSKQQLSLDNISEGDIIIFPSFIRHRVLKQETDEVRITSSFNINTIKGSARRVFCP